MKNQYLLYGVIAFVIQSSAIFADEGLSEADMRSLSAQEMDEVQAAFRHGGAAAAKTKMREIKDNQRQGLRPNTPIKSEVEDLRPNTPIKSEVEEVRAAEKHGGINAAKTKLREIANRRQAGKTNTPTPTHNRTK